MVENPFIQNYFSKESNNWKKSTILDGFNSEGYALKLPNAWRGVNKPYPEDEEPKFGGKTDLLGAKFSAPDNDQTSNNCAKNAKAGWWYKERISNDNFNPKAVGIWSFKWRNLNISKFACF